MTGTSDPLVVDEVVLVVVFVCPHEYVLVVVDVYPPVICVLLPEEFVCALLSFVESPNAVVASNTNNIIKLFLNKATSKI